MSQPQSQQAYDSAIENLCKEFAREIGSGGANNVAQQLVASYDVIGGKPVVNETPGYEGGSVAAIDSRFFPLTVLQYTRADSLTQARESVTNIAIKALQADLIAAHSGSYNVDEQDRGEPEKPRAEV